MGSANFTDSRHSAISPIIITTSLQSVLPCERNGGRQACATTDGRVRPRPDGSLIATYLRSFRSIILACSAAFELSPPQPVVTVSSHYRRPLRPGDSHRTHLPRIQRQGNNNPHVKSTWRLPATLSSAP